MSGRPAPRLLPLGGEIIRAAGAAGRRADGRNEAARHNEAARPGEAARLVGAKAARLARAAAAGLTVLPGWALPVAEAAPALSAGAAAVRQGRPAAARRAVLGHRLDDHPPPQP